MLDSTLIYIQGINFAGDIFSAPRSFKLRKTENLFYLFSFARGCLGLLETREATVIGSKKERKKKKEKRKKKKEKRKKKKER